MLIDNHCIIIVLSKSAKENDMTLINKQSGREITNDDLFDIFFDNAGIRELIDIIEDNYTPTQYFEWCNQFFKSTPKTNQEVTDDLMNMTLDDLRDAVVELIDYDMLWQYEIYAGWIEEEHE